MIDMNRLYVYFFSLLGCHIAIFSSIFRLAEGVLRTVLIIPRFDCSIYARTWEKSGKILNRASGTREI